LIRLEDSTSRLNVDEYDCVDDTSLREALEGHIIDWFEQRPTVARLEGESRKGRTDLFDYLPYPYCFRGSAWVLASQLATAGQIHPFLFEAFVGLLEIRLSIGWKGLGCIEEAGLAKAKGLIAGGTAGIKSWLRE